MKLLLENWRQYMNEDRDWYPEKYDSYDDWMGVWQDRLDDGTDDVNWKTIIRGFPLNVDLPLPIVRKIKSGKMTSDDILSLIGNTVGKWWHLHGAVDIADSRVYAESDMALNSPDVYEHDGKVDFDLPIVLVAERPEWWHPDDNPGGGLMGNSFVDPSRWSTVRLKEIQYDTTGDDDWVIIPTDKEISI